MLSSIEVQEMLQQMFFIRHFEEKSNLAYRTGKAGGYLHVYTGSESVAVGWLRAIKVGYDNVITAYRDHAHALMLGSDPVAAMAEIMGRKGGLSDGKGGSMHLYDIPKRFFGGWGIVGGHVPIGTGLALASRYQNEDRVTLNFMGDGASDAGVVYESLNMASLYNLPCIFIIENNRFSMGTRLEYHASDTELHKRGYPFNMKHERIDGMDVLNMYENASRIIDYVRKERKPYLVEVMCYRFAGHGAADNDQSLYRTKQELEEAVKQDPIMKLSAYIKKQNWMTQEEINQLDKQVLEEAERVFKEADAMPVPDSNEVYTHVYTDMDVERGH
jgi:pyruvate dehydrogenase E1 component alpha subunit